MRKQQRFSYLKAQKKYAGKFVARKGGEILVAGMTLGTVLKKLREKGIKHSPAVIIGHVPPANAICIYVTD